MEQIEFIEEQVAALDEAIEQVLDELWAEHVPGHLTEGRRHVIETIPGIGPVLAAAIIGEIGDVRRFRNARKLVAYAGIEATTRQSGQFIGTRSRTSKGGWLYPRRAVWLAAMPARRLHPQFKAYYEAKKAEGKHPLVVAGAIARRLLHVDLLGMVAGAFV